MAIDQKQLETDTDEMVAFEKHLANISVSKEERRSPKHPYTKIKIGDIKKFAPLIDWERFLIGIAPEEVRSRLSNETEVVLVEPSYMIRLNALLNATEPHVVANYVLTQFAAKYIAQSGERYENALLVRKRRL